MDKRAQGAQKRWCLPVARGLYIQFSQVDLTGDYLPANSNVALSPRLR
jgi:hypothetical protein